MRKQYIVIFLVLFAGLNTKAQTSLGMPVDSTLHILNSYAQPASLTSATTAPQQEYLHYLRSAKTLKILGWTSLGVGIPTMCVGLLLGVSSAYSETNGDGLNNAANWIMASGAALTLSSIPLFIVSHHYKTKGNKLKTVSLSLGSQQVFIPQGNRFVSGVQPALSVKVSL
jgi:ABC-type spermidine/putrescine transport system permease subunit I